ncbi:expressed conserved protein [Echinococcus multilocularis]|uniref:Expressed conserved protein n=1 Tax=Echinococcus multilocularis TaxID=6211 RepID=A0A068Y9B4_ECHMU|nr:expressed conserved protein [Echinococcus multilocularis]
MGNGLTMEKRSDTEERGQTESIETKTVPEPASVPTAPKLTMEMHTGVAIAARLHQGTRSLGPTLLERAQGGKAVEADNLAKRCIRPE